MTEQPRKRNPANPPNPSAEDIGPPKVMGLPGVTDDRHLTPFDGEYLPPVVILEDEHGWQQRWVRDDAAYRLALTLGPETEYDSREARTKRETTQTALRAKHLLEELHRIAQRAIEFAGTRDYETMERLLRPLAFLADEQKQDHEYCVQVEDVENMLASNCSTSHLAAAHLRLDFGARAQARIEAAALEFESILRKHGPRAPRAATKPALERETAEAKELEAAFARGYQAGTGAKDAGQSKENP